MVNRVRRKFKSYTFKLGGQIGKIVITRIGRCASGKYFWNISAVAGNSRRQINDWYRGRKNRRTRSLTRRMTGLQGYKGIHHAVEMILRFRWEIDPGDVVRIDCTSGQPEKQYRVLSRWFKKYPDIVADPVKLEYYWYRPPYPDDSIWDDFNIFPITPDNPMADSSDDRYYDCFLVQPKDPDIVLPKMKIPDLLSQVQANEPLRE